MTNRGLWLGVLLGTPLLLLGVRDVLVQANRTHPFELARWVIGAALVVDLAILPLSLLVGRAVRGRPALRWAASSIAVTLLVSWPYVRGYGRSRSNPSLLPRDYAGGVLVAVAATIVAAAAWALVSKSLRVPEAPAASDPGDAGLFRLDGGRTALRLENLDIDNGPDLQPYIVPGADQLEPGATSLHLGALRGNVGNQTYDLPVDFALPPGGGPCSCGARRSTSSSWQQPSTSPEAHRRSGISAPNSRRER